MNTHEVDLTKGNVLRTLARFSIPILATNILQSFYSMADMLVVGHFVGDTGLAAISNASMLVFLITSVSIGFSMGGNVLVARCKGAGDAEGQNLSVSVLFASMFLLSLVVTVATLAGYGPLFRLMEVPDEALTDANEYMRNYFNHMHPPYSLGADFKPSAWRFLNSAVSVLTVSLFSHSM